jgi:hypothetical protein
MDHISIASQSQDLVHVQSKIDDFFGRFKIATLMHRCGMRKHHGHSIRSLTQAIFTLPFVGKNFFRGIVLNSQLPFGKDAAYDQRYLPINSFKSAKNSGERGSQVPHLAGIWLVSRAQRASCLLVSRYPV